MPDKANAQAIWTATPQTHWSSSWFQVVLSFQPLSLHSERSCVVTQSITSYTSFWWYNCSVFVLAYYFRHDPHAEWNVYARKWRSFASGFSCMSAWRDECGAVLSGGAGVGAWRLSWSCAWGELRSGGRRPTWTSCPAGLGSCFYLCEESERDFYLHAHVRRSEALPIDSILVGLLALPEFQNLTLSMMCSIAVESFRGIDLKADRTGFALSCQSCPAGSRSVHYCCYLSCSDSTLIWLTPTAPSPRAWAIAEALWKILHCYRWLSFGALSARWRSCSLSVLPCWHTFCPFSFSSLQASAASHLMFYFLETWAIAPVLSWGHGVPALTHGLPRDSGTSCPI